MLSVRISSIKPRHRPSSTGAIQTSSTRPVLTSSRKKKCNHLILRFTSLTNRRSNKTMEM